MGLSLIGSSNNTLKCRCYDQDENREVERHFSGKVKKDSSLREVAKKECKCSSVDTTPNPNPFSFSISSIEKGTYYDIITVKYNHCTTYNGYKILLVESGSVTKDIKELDPHFLESGFIVGRFRPTVEGIMLAKILKDKKV